jgi:hypothetical protein
MRQRPRFEIKEIFPFTAKANAFLPVKIICVVIWVAAPLPHAAPD